MAEEIHIKFSWPKLPQTDAEFDELMRSVDKTLADAGLHTFQRPLHVPRLLGEAFSWSGPVVPQKHLAEQAGFEGAVLMAKVHRWYEHLYGDQLKADLAFGYFPIRLRNSIWRVRAGLIHGTVEFFIDRNLKNRGTLQGTRGTKATCNMLCAVQDLPQGLATSLSDAELHQFATFYRFALEALIWRHDTLRSELFDMPRADYAASTDDLLGRRYGQARWGAQQAVEKTLKGLLTLAGQTYPTGGPNGHNLKHLSELLNTTQNTDLSPSLLELAACSAKVRYAEEPSSEEQALRANHAVLGIFEQIRKSAHTQSLLASLQTV